MNADRLVTSTAPTALCVPRPDGSTICTGGPGPVSGAIEVPALDGSGLALCATVLAAAALCARLGARA